MRISCASFVRFTDPEGRLALLVNKDQYDQGKIVLVPIGGAMQVSVAEGHEIMRLLNLTEADFDKPFTHVVDLRFTVDDSLEEEVRRLYSTWDADPRREVYEELVTEAGILTDAEFNVANFALAFIGTDEEKAVSTRSGKAFGQETLRLISVYDLSCDKVIAEKLCATGFPLYFVTPQEITDQRSRTGVEIAPVSKKLLVL